jgi:restriction system protein
MDTSMSSGKGPKFVSYFWPVVQALQQLGGSGTPSEVRDQVRQNLGLAEKVAQDMLPSGTSRFDNWVGWARFYLVKAGYIDASKRGVWSLTESGQATQGFSNKQAFELFKRIHGNFKPLETGGAEAGEDLPPEPEASQSYGNYRVQLMDILCNLPSEGFERFCQRLLREAGFEQVTVTGRSGDGGIDGIGILQVNPLVSFKVLFQCKRYAGTVGASQLRDFRGAMMGRTDKGIFITTGTFTSDARKEAVRDGVPPIELVDGEKIVEMLRSMELGLRPVTVYEVEEKFFEEFKK